MRQFFSRRWILFALAVGLLAYGTIWLGEWQFHRLDERKALNVVTTTNLRAEPVPVATVLAVGKPLDTAHEWAHVTAVGRYAEDETVLVRYQTRDTRTGVDVVTPLVTDAGPAVLVDRGWIRTTKSGRAAPVVPPAPQGEVRVTGWVRADATGDSTRVSHGSTRSVSSAAIGRGLPFPVYGGFMDAATESPPPAQPLVKAELPDLTNGPHFFYGLQWWFFSALSIFGFLYLAWDERRKRRESPSPDRQSADSQTPEHSPVDREHHA